MTYNRLPTRPWLALGAIAAALAIPSHVPAAATAPLPVTSFHEVALQGFGDYQNSWPWSAAWYKGRLYVGTDRNEMCVASADAVPYPPVDPDLHCPGAPPTLQSLVPTLGAQIWSVDPSTTSSITQSNWTENYVSPLTVSIPMSNQIIMAPRDAGFRGMSVFTEQDGTQSLYASGVSLKGLAGTAALPPSLLRSSDGVSFQAVPADPGTTMGDINVLTTTAVSPCCMRGQASFRGYFYVNIVSGIGSGSLFASPTPQVGNDSFAQITPQSMAVYEVEPFNGHLYLGVASSAGYSVWRTDCTAPPPGQRTCPWSAFTQVIPPGAGLAHNVNVSVTSMHVFTDTTGIGHLYIGTASEVTTNPGAAELSRVNTDDSWDLVVGTPRTVNRVRKSPLSGLAAGFGWPFNFHMWRMMDYNGVLYVGTYDASTSFFKGTGQQAQYQQYRGFDLYASVDGAHFQPVTMNGFGDMFSEGVRGLVSTPYGLFVGAANHWYGLRIWQGAVSAEAMRLSSSLLEGEPIAAGAIALAWQRPRQAVLFHVYRSEARQTPLPWPVGRKGSAERRSPMVWLPGAYHEIGVTSEASYVDRSLHAGQHASYYVVTQDAQSHLSLPSTIATVPSLAPLATFHDAATLLTKMVTHHGSTSSQVHMLQGALGKAAEALRSGNLRGSQADLEALGQSVIADEKTGTAQQSAEALTGVLHSLSIRETLFMRHGSLPW